MKIAIEIIIKLLLTGWILIVGWFFDPPKMGNALVQVWKL